MSKNIIFFLLLSMPLTNHLSGAQGSATDGLDGLINRFNKGLQLDEEETADTRKIFSNNNNATRAEPDDQDQNEQELDGDEKIIVTADNTAVQIMKIPVKEGGFVTAILKYKNPLEEVTLRTLKKLTTITLKYCENRITCYPIERFCQSIKDMALDINPDKFINTFYVSFNKAFNAMMSSKEYSDQALNDLSYLICQQFRCLENRNIRDNQELLTNVFSNSARFTKARQTCQKMDKKRNDQYNEIKRNMCNSLSTYKDKLTLFVPILTLLGITTLFADPALRACWQDIKPSFHLTNFFEACACKLGLSAESIAHVLMKLFTDVLSFCLCTVMPCSFSHIHSLVNYGSTIPLHRYNKLLKIKDIFLGKKSSWSGIIDKSIIHLEKTQEYIISPTIFFIFCSLFSLALVENNDKKDPTVILLSLTALLNSLLLC